MLSTGTCWLHVSGTGWLQVYSVISHSDSVAVVSSFDTYFLGQKDGARIASCSHLLVVVREHRGL
jgi:hypothetical protein